MEHQGRTVNDHWTAAMSMRALELPAGQPVLVIRRVAFAYHDKPVEYRVSYVDTRHHDYVGDTLR